MARNRIATRALACLALILASGVTYWLFADIRQEAMDDLPPFERWSRSSPEDRRPAAEALIAENLLVGTTRPEVLRLLGCPTSEGYNGKYLLWYVGYIKNKRWDFGLYDDRIFLEVVFTGDIVSDARFHIDYH